MSKPGLRRRLVVQSILAAIAFAILVSLGVWQVERLRWKEGLIARVESRLDAPPVPAPGPDRWADLDLGELEYERVSVSGRFRNADEVHVVYTLTEPRGPVGGIGYQVMTPLVTDDGWIVYVNRGFVPEAKKDPETRPGGQIDGETTVTGLLRAPHTRSWFTPGDDVADNAWFTRDPKVYAAASGLPPAEVAPYLIDAAFDPNLPGGLPQGGETLVTFPNNHLQYAITWFGLAIALAVIFPTFAVRQLRSGGREEPPQA